MKIAAVVAEYNPFHFGHKYHLEQTRNAGASHIVCVMSGNYVQRGEPAFYDKFMRARAAVENGADLVIELPVPWAIGGAQSFARGAVSLVKAMGNVDMLSFGCENGDVAALEEISRLVYSADFKGSLEKHLASGVTFATARQMAVADLSGEESARLLASPNNILATEYIAAADYLNAKIDFFGVKRLGDGYNESAISGNGFASASAIRAKIARNEDASAYSPMKLNGDYADLTNVQSAVLYKLRTMSPQEISLLPDVSEGLENRIYSAARKAKSLDELFEAVKTKRYTMARLKRIILSAFLGISAEQASGLPPYIRVLACNGNGKEILKTATPSLPLVTRSVQMNSAGEIAALEARADDAYALCFNPAHECDEWLKERIYY